MEKTYTNVYGIEKASILKRISAYILDGILTIIIVTGVLFALSGIVKYDSYYEKMDSFYLTFEEENGFSYTMFNKTEEELNEKEKKIKEISSKNESELTLEEKEFKTEYEKAIEDFANNEDVLYTYNLLINLTLLITTISVLVAIIIVEFIIPLFLKNGQTIGKKCFGICLVKNNCVRINNIMLFVRAVLGKFTIETMIPLYIIILIIFGGAGITGTFILFLILVIQLVLIIATKNNSLIHDLMAGTVVVDKTSQMMFNSEEELVKFKQDFYKEEAKNQTY